MKQCLVFLLKVNLRHECIKYLQENVAPDMRRVSEIQAGHAIYKKLGGNGSVDVLIEMVNKKI